ncbi:MAG TPA: tetratricopeptide repeat protein, partial [Pseudolysinimonas sp.]|nr:tetratricopeptide repeat protein [Pseudolysinimonas sp.]
MNEGLIDALRRAVEAAPDDAALRLHLAELLLTNGGREEAVSHLATLLANDPDNASARGMMSSALSASIGPVISFDWDAAEQQVEPRATPSIHAGPNEDNSPVLSAENPLITLSDVGGMHAVKERIEAAFIAPLKNPELRALYGATLRGGLLMYGPPGCGKTFLARAIAGELDAAFLSITLNDVLDPMLGVSERSLHEAFESARALAPCV